MRSSFFTAVSTFLVLVGLAGCNENTEITDKQNQFDDKLPTKCSSCPKYNQRMDSVLFVREVMHFVADKADVGNVKHALCDTFNRIEFNQLPVDSYLKLFEADEGTATCGLAASIMAKILVENGFDAYTYNFGFENTPMTHVVVLVKNEGRLLVFDPYMNFELVDELGDNMSMSELLVNISEESKKIFFCTKSLPSDLLIDFKKLNTQERELVKKPEVVQLLRQGLWTTDSVLKVIINRCFRCGTVIGEKEFILGFEEQLKLNTDFNVFHQSFALKINKVWGAADADSVDTFIETKLVKLGLR